MDNTDLKTRIEILRAHREALSELEAVFGSFQRVDDNCDDINLDSLDRESLARAVAQMQLRWNRIGDFYTRVDDRMDAVLERLDKVDPDFQMEK